MQTVESLREAEEIRQGRGDCIVNTDQSDVATSQGMLQLLAGGGKKWILSQRLCWMERGLVGTLISACECVLSRFSRV